MIQQALQEQPPVEASMIAALLSRGFGESSQGTCDITFPGTYSPTAVEIKHVKEMQKANFGEALGRLNPLAESPEQIQYVIEINKSLACSIELKTEGIMISEEVRRFLCEGLPDSEANRIKPRLGDLKQIISDTFRNVISISLEMFENPEVPEERNIRIKICLRKSEKSSFQLYRLYTRSFIKAFPFEFRQWFVTCINYV
jgi:hypothetical protein